MKFDLEALGLVDFDAYCSWHFSEIIYGWMNFFYVHVMNGSFLNGLRIFVVIFERNPNFGMEKIWIHVRI